MKYVLILMLLVPFAAHATCTHDWMNCPIGSLTHLGSFTWEAADTIDRVTEARRLATERLKKHQITAKHAQAVLIKTDKARALSQQAVSVCHANDDGDCDTAEHSTDAFALLTQAREAIK